MRFDKGVLSPSPKLRINSAKGPDRWGIPLPRFFVVPIQSGLLRMTFWAKPYCYPIYATGVRPQSTKSMVKLMGRTAHPI